MNLKQIEKRARRVASKATALGFQKNGVAMVIDQAREIVAAEEGFRNWHTMRAAVAATKPSAHPAASAEQAPATRPTYDQLYRTLYAIASQTDICTSEGTADRFVDELLASARETLGMTLDAAGDLVAAQPDSALMQGRFSRAQCQQAEEQGWGLFDAEGELQIQRLDESGLFADDAAAWQFVIAQAAQNPHCAAAAALNQIHRDSPLEWQRLVEFDHKHSQQLRPRSSAGHVVDRAEVAEWVGLHYGDNFDTNAQRQQEWIDRFCEAHNRHGFLVAESWEHCFVGDRASTVRWVFQLHSDVDGVVFAQIQRTGGRWMTLDRAAMRDLEESIFDNDIPDTFRTKWHPEVKGQPDLPAWATHARSSDNA
ncbi:hypothetical protein [Rubrivivax gelatinosus]|uniref:hypothetical protein n=1 Tax=Rubrivivax gelatinosus TaxID=28068 RepID=UPI0002FEA079|nr:hypothetical protein [Rubrivivax gelatinosus]MBG6083037.1 hypothetical protein [Rubrivivax gelatinosus]